MSQPPPVPTYIFRGHAAPVHALHFFACNAYLASGDSDGWIIIWSLSTKRPLAVWKAHEGGIMGLKDWHSHRLISHGRDHKLRVWQLRSESYSGMDLELPVDGADASQAKQPWLLHSLSVNALNYCAFSICADDPAMLELSERSNEALLLAAPNGLDAGGIDIFQLPSEHRVCKLPSDKGLQTGMVMAVALFRHPTRKALVLASGYETGHVLVHVNNDNSEHGWNWVQMFAVHLHSQPVLSIDASPTGEYVFSSSADAVLGKINVDAEKVEKKVDTKHAGQQDLKVRDDGKVFVTAGWDKRIRVYSAKTLKELAVLKWHQEGCYSTAFAKTDLSTEATQPQPAADALIKAAVDLIQNEHTSKPQSVHWLAAGGKDGKVSLWNIY